MHKKNLYLNKEQVFDAFFNNWIYFFWFADFTLLRSLVNLEALECLNFTNIDDYALIQVIKHCNKLQVLKLPGCKFTDYSIAQLPRFCPNLQKLCIKASQVLYTF